MYITGPADPEKLYLVYDRREFRGFWRAERSGYTIWPGSAGVYTGREANQITGRTAARPHGREDFWVFPLADAEADADHGLVKWAAARERAPGLEGEAANG